MIGGILGLAFGYVTSATLKDEAGCIWWWWGQDYGAWLMANLWRLSSSVGMSIAVGVLLQQGYLRIGDYTFVDGIGAGNP